MHISATSVTRALTTAVWLVVAATAAPTAQEPFRVEELANYRLTSPTLARFETASRQIAEATRSDRRFAYAPLLTRELALLDDAPAAAAQLELRLRVEPAFSRALSSAGISPREFTTFALALLGARLAQGFVESGVLRGVPPGVAADNVAFVDVNRRTVASVMADLGVAQ